MCLKKVKRRFKSALCYALIMGMIFGSTVSATETEMGTEAQTESQIGSSGDESDSVSSGDISSDLDNSLGLTNVFIRLSAGKNIVSDTEKLSELSTDEIKFLGVFLSNYYIPFGTELGVADGEVLEKNKSEMKKALQSELKFTDSMADSLIDDIIGLSRSNNKELVICVSEEYQKELINVGLDLDMFSALAVMSGRLGDYVLNMLPEIEKDKEKFDSEETSGSETNETDLEGYAITEDKKEFLKNIDLEVFKELVYDDSKYKYAYFAYDDGSGNYTPVFDATIDPGGKDAEVGMTPSMVAFWKCMESVDFEKGYGLSVLDISEKEMGGSDKSAIKEFSSKITSNKDLYELSNFATRLRVDCFGNIIYMGKTHQFVGVPACMNPYVWQQVDAQGNDTSNPAGSFYNMINIPSISMQDRDSSGRNLFSIKSVEDIKDENRSRKGLVGTKDLANRIANKDMSRYSAEINDKLGPGEGSTAVNLYPNKDINRVINKSGYSLKARMMRGSSVHVMDNSWYQNIVNWFSSIVGSIAWQDADFKFLKGIIDGAKGSRKEIGYALNNTNYNTKTIYVLGPDIKKGKDGKDKIFKMAGNGKINFFDTMMYMDTLGAFKFDDSNSDLDWQCVNPAHYLDIDGSDEDTKIASIRNSYSDGANGFGSNKFSEIVEGNMNLISGSKPEATVSIYTTYCYASCYSADAKADTIGKLGYRMNFDMLPDVSEKPLDVNSTAREDTMSTAIKQWLYYLLHPTEGFNYVRILLTNTINSVLLGWHNAMLGTNGVGVVTGTTQYRSTVGYVTTPDLSEIEWTTNLIKIFQSSIPYLAIAMLIIFVFIFIIGILPFQKCIIGFLIFCFCLLIPVPLINGTVGTSNRLLSNLYGEKFTYWALVQHQTYSTLIDEKSNGDSYENYLRALYNTNSMMNPNQGGESVNLKWQAPKKMSSLMFTKKDTDSVNGLTMGLLTGAIANTYSHEAYVDDEDTTYLYRSYIDIANFSRYIYRGIKNGTVKPVKKLNSKNMDGFFDKELKNALKNNGFESTVKSDTEQGYTNKVSSGSTTGTDYIHILTPLTSSIMNEAFKQYGDYMSNLSIDDYVGINQDYFNFSIPMFNVKDVNMEETLVSQAKSKDFQKELDKIEDLEENLVGLASYGLYSENVFYYFSWLLYDCGLSPEALTSGGYKNLLLGEDNAGFFYNTTGNGELKDFMDMRSLFTYIIPYLKQGNDVVHQWDKIYGTKIYGGVSTEEGNQGAYKGNKELAQKYWNNLNVARLYNMWTPWVGLMYDCSYAKPEKVKVLGSTYWVDDPIDPMSYPKDRPMIFSRSEMADYGLTEADLTTVEQKIIKCNDEMEEALFELLNYHNFNDVVLNTAAAMNCAFIFNSNFSENSLFGNNINIYPQSFELTDFSYDAFLRFILSESTGEDITNGEDFYGEVVKKSSLTTSICLIILDIISMYIVPGIKIFFLILIFLASILVILVSIFRLNENQRFLTRFFVVLVRPMLLFFVISMGMGYLISLFMGTGNNKVTGTNTGTIKMGDPAMVIIIMMVINVLFIILYFKVLRSVWRSIKSMGKMVGGFGVGVVSALGGALAGRRLVAGMSGNGSSGYNGGGYSGKRYSAESSGGENTRATSRTEKSVTIINKEDTHMHNEYTRDESELRSQERRSRSIPEEQRNSEGYHNAERGEERRKKIDRTIDSGREKIKRRDKENEAILNRAIRSNDRAYRKAYRDARKDAQKDMRRYEKRNYRLSGKENTPKYEKVSVVRDSNGKVSSVTKVSSNRKRDIKDKK